jgi:isoleucyl-tRNA synthetase
MPFAQHRSAAGPVGDAHRERPADLVAESADQAGDWFGALLTVGMLAYGRPAFGTALRLGAVLDDRGRPMTSGLGNLVEPLPLIERHGADAARWYLAAAAPGAAVKMSGAALAEVAATVLLSYWNTAAFLAGAATDAAGPGRAWRHAQRQAPPPGMRPMLDRWILSELQCLVRDVTSDLADYDSASATGRIAGFLDALASRYLRWSGRRFRPDAADPSRLAALATVHECLDTLTRTMAPIIPIRLGRPGGPDSVHLTTWPVPVPALIDDQLASQVALAGRLAELGRSARAAAAIGLRQPLARAAVTGDGINAVSSELIGILAEQLSVGSVEILPVPPDAHGQRLVRPNLAAIGRRFGHDALAVAAAVDGADPAAVIADLDSSGTFAAALAGTRVALSAAEVIVTTQPLSGWIVAAENGEMVALDAAQPA